MTKARKSDNKGVDSPVINNTLEASGSEVVEKRKRGRPKGVGRKPKPVEPMTKMVDGKLMKRAVGVPKKVKTGKRGRPRKEYVWVEAN